MTVCRPLSCGPGQAHAGSASPVHPPVTQQTGGLTSFDTTIFCTLRAAVWQPAPADCWDAAHGVSLAPTISSYALYWPPSGSLLRLVALLRRFGGSPASTTPSSAPVAGVLGVGLAGPDNTIFCTLRAAVRQQAPAGCRAAHEGLAGSDYTRTSLIE